MENKKNKRKLFKRIGAIVGAVVVAIVAFSLPFLGNFNSKFNSNNKIASADEVLNVSYISNTWVLPYSYGSENASGGFTPSHSVSDPFRFGLINTSSGLQLTVNILESVVSDFITSSYSIDINVGAFDFYMPRNDYSLLTIFAFYNLSSSSFSVSDIIYADLFSTNHESGLRWVSLKWFDKNANSFEVGFYFYPGTSDALSHWIPYNARIYLPNSLNADYTSGYKQGYSEGYSSGENIGYTNGYSSGESAGYSSGYSAGETIGYNNGYSQGIEAGDKYSFFSLVSAVIDAPIQAFMGLFNFELLGINLAGFFTGLLTLAFIITIVRLVMP